MKHVELPARSVDYVKHRCAKARFDCLTGKYIFSISNGSMRNLEIYEIDTYSELLKTMDEFGGDWQTTLNCY